MERALGYAVAGVSHTLHGHLDWISEQILPDSAELPQLLRWGGIWELFQKGKTKATGPAVFTGTDGSSLSADVEMQRDDGTEYKVTVGGVVSGGSVTVTVEALDAGAGGNAETGEPLTLTGPVAGIDSEGSVGSPGITGGADVEDPEDYRARVLQRLDTPPRGGGKGDYESWALEVSGVTRAWEYAHRNGVGTVGLTFLMDDRTDPIPLAADIATVQAYLDDVAPIDMRDVLVFGLTANVIDLSVTLVVEAGADVTAVRAAAESELEDLFLREAEPEKATPAQSRISEAISVAAGEQSHTIDSISSLDPGTAGINVLGTVTWS